jgi:hypothetical protein
LNVTNVTASEVTGNYIYDLCDRGQFQNPTLFQNDGSSVDITERYPAFNIISAVRLMLNQVGANLDASNIPDYYFPFLGDENIRNSTDWVSSTKFLSNADGTQTISDFGAGGVPVTFLLEDYVEFKTEDFDDGNNFEAVTGKTYTIPETGTYKFKTDFDISIVITGAASTSSEVGIVSIKKNGTDIAHYDITVPGTWTTLNVYGAIDTHFIECAAGDELNVYFYFTGLVSGAGWSIDATMATTTKFYNDVSRWYGAGSTVDFSKIVPDVTALQFLSDVFNYLNLYTFYREELKTLTLFSGRSITDSIDNLELLQINENITEATNFILKFNTDKASPPADIRINSGASIESELSYPFSQTLIAPCTRVFISNTETIPILWESKEKRPGISVVPPDWVVKGNQRVLLFGGVGTSVIGYTLTYGGSNTDNSTNRKEYPIFTDPYISLIHYYDLSLEGTIIKAICKLSIAKLYDQTLFKSPVTVDNLGLFWILQADQLESNIFNVTLESANGIVNSSIVDIAEIHNFILSIGGEKLITLDSDYIIH